MEDAKQQLIDRLKSANNILVTVSRDPSVDQLSALLGLTLLLNKQGKHAAAVFSGQIPSTIEFLQPEDTFEKNTDSLRDFIIALDKNKADKLRYKVEDNVVRIFITPYKTSISQEDFEFSQGDFNVDLVVALGVHQQEDLDDAITAHGRILHDATLASINTLSGGGLGTINWDNSQASSLSELVTSLVHDLDPTNIDEQIATALLTGIVSETDRFSNDKTTSQTMSLSAALMTAGANQQLVASKLAEPVTAPVSEQAELDETPVQEEAEQTEEQPEPKPEDGTIEIAHEETPAEDDADQPAKDNTDDELDLTSLSTGLDLPTPDENAATPDDEIEPAAEPENQDLSTGGRLITEPPTLPTGQLTANASVPVLEPALDPLGAAAPPSTPLLAHDDTPSAPVDDTPDAPLEETSAIEPPVVDEQPAEPSLPTLTPPPADWTPPVPAAPAPEPAAPTPPAFAGDPFNLNPDGDGQPTSDPSLAELEISVDSTEPASVDDARDEVSRALNTADAADAATPAPIQALNAQPFDVDLHGDTAPVADSQTSAPADSSATLPADPQPSIVPFPPIDQPAAAPVQQQEPVDPNAPPPVPPPIPFNFGGNPPATQ